MSTMSMPDPDFPRSWTKGSGAVAEWDKFDFSTNRQSLKPLF